MAVGGGAIILCATLYNIIPLQAVILSAKYTGWRENDPSAHMHGYGRAGIRQPQFSMPGVRWYTQPS